jgi:hypothetical protein
MPLCFQDQGEDLLVKRIQLVGETVQQLRPVGYQLLFQQLLRLPKIFYPGKTANRDIKNEDF